MSFANDKTVIGLTGGIACGKSSALQIFKDLGWDTLSTDRIVADLISTNESVIEKLSIRWGKTVFSVNNEVVKGSIADIIFNDEEERGWLEELLHPLVRSTWTRSVESSGAKHLVVEILIHQGRKCI